MTRLQMPNGVSPKDQPRQLKIKAPCAAPWQSRYRQRRKSRPTRPAKVRSLLYERESDKYRIYYLPDADQYNVAANLNGSTGVA